ncbi:MAG: Hpt domain-containing protein [Desulfobacteraceae bacterium]|nr:Hpt domain-containing protein [Desulfobacteraceae bacterium]MCF8094608.1 Hpt domain-containing protein [Desulfobacteraceae bacterium]
MANNNSDVVFDKADFLARVEGDLELARQLAEMFFDDAHLTIELIRERMGQNDADGTMRAAHSLKGASANLSALRLRRSLADLEYAAKENNLSRAAEIFAGLKQELDDFSAELKRHRILD